MDRDSAGDFQGQQSREKGKGTARGGGEGRYRTQVSDLRAQDKVREERKQKCMSGLA